MKHLTLFELNQFIQRVFYLNFEESVWIEAEIAECRDHNGHLYMTLVEKDPGGQLIAKASCSIWQSKAIQLKKSLGPLFSQVTKTGNKVKVLCKVEFHPRYGYSLHAEDFDPAFTEGFLYLEKKKTIERLQNAGLFDRNKSLGLPEVIQRIAVVSSSTSAGYQDFMHQLTENPHGYQFFTELFISAMQGDKVNEQFTSALAAIQKRRKEFDVIVVVRGGGASVDLSDFDGYEVAAAVAQSPLPVLAGIGHERDISVTDMVSFARVKTPTAAAEMILNNNLRFENSIQEIYLNIREHIRDKIHMASQELYQAGKSLQHGIKSKTDKERFLFEKRKYALLNLIKKRIYDERLEIQQMRLWIIDNNPFLIMQRGYTMVFQDQIRIKDLSKLNADRPVNLYMDKQNITINER